MTLKEWARLSLTNLTDHELDQVVSNAIKSENAGGQSAELCIEFFARLTGIPKEIALGDGNGSYSSGKLDAAAREHETCTDLIVRPGQLEPDCFSVRNQD